MSIRRFKVATKLDGASEVTVEITPAAGGTDAVVTVRPKHKRVKYSGLLSFVAQFVAARDAKLKAQAQGINVPLARKVRTRKRSVRTVDAATATGMYDHDDIN